MSLVETFAVPVLISRRFPTQLTEIVCCLRNNKKRKKPNGIPRIPGWFAAE